MTTVPGPGNAPATPTKAPAAKKEPAEKKATVKKESTGVSRPRLPKYPDEHVITVLKEGAKARAAADRFKRYVTGMTVKAYIDKITEDFSRTEGQTFADMRWDEDHKFIHIGPTVIDVPKPAPAPEKTAAPATTPAA